MILVVVEAPTVRFERIALLGPWAPGLQVCKRAAATRRLS